MKTNQHSQKKKQKASFESISEILNSKMSNSKKGFLIELEKRKKQHEKENWDSNISGIPTSFVDLDRLINGFEKSQLIVLGGRTAMGKTALALNIAENICFKNGMPVGIFSLEMSSEQITNRMLSSCSEVDLEKIKTGRISNEEHQRILDSAKCIRSSTLLIDINPGGLSIIDLRERAHLMKEKHNIQFLVIDYLQLLSVKQPSEPSENRPHDLSEIARILKHLSKELDIPILCTSQLSRKVEERQGHRPLMTDLRDCGAIEDHADVVMFLLRREYYDPYDKPGCAELIVGKNRHGGVGSINLIFRKELAQFVNYSITLQQESESSDAFAAFK